MTHQQAHLVGPIEADHHVLRGQLEELAQVADRMGVLPSLQNLPRMLARHFADEEAGGGLYEDLTRRCPAVSKDIARLRGEHRAILEELEALIREIQGHPDADGGLPQRARQAVAHCMERLRRHERTESSMIADVYYTDEGGRG